MGAAIGTEIAKADDALDHAHAPRAKMEAMIWLAATAKKDARRLPLGTRPRKNPRPPLLLKELLHPTVLPRDLLLLLPLLMHPLLTLPLLTLPLLTPPLPMLPLANVGGANANNNGTSTMRHLGSSACGLWLNMIAAYTFHTRRRACYLYGKPGNHDFRHASKTNKTKPSESGTNTILLHLCGEHARCCQHQPDDHACG